MKLPRRKFLYLAAGAAALPERLRLPIRPPRGPGGYAPDPVSKTKKKKIQNQTSVFRSSRELSRCLSSALASNDAVQSYSQFVSSV
jgi:hypothetical protein